MKKMIFIMAALTLVACSNSKDTPKSLTPAGEVQQKASTEETTHKLTENDFCVVDMFDRVSKTLNFDYSDNMDGTVERWMTWKDMDVQKNEPQHINTGAWEVKDDTVTITDLNTGEAVTYKVEFTEEDNTVTGVNLVPQREDQKDYKAEYEVCGIKEKLVRKAQLKKLAAFHEKNGM